MPMPTVKRTRAPASEGRESCEIQRQRACSFTQNGFHLTMNRDLHALERSDSQKRYRTQDVRFSGALPRRKRFPASARGASEFSWIHCSQKRRNLLAEIGGMAETREFGGLCVARNVGRSKAEGRACGSSGRVQRLRWGTTKIRTERPGRRVRKRSKNQRTIAIKRAAKRRKSFLSRGEGRRERRRRCEQTEKPESDAAPEAARRGARRHAECTAMRYVADSR